MNERKNAIYNELYSKLCTKDELADKFSKTTKTIENTIKDCDDIGYSKKLGAYYFKNLLPQLISYRNYFDLVKENFSNPLLKKDTMKITEEMHSDLDNMMIDTDSLSALSKKIIQANIAINHNCVLRVSYEGNEKVKEEKYIQPNQIIATGAIYYLYVIYDQRNKKNIGESRQLAFNGIDNIEPIEYVSDQTFRTQNIGNSFGRYDENSKKILLRLSGPAANFFKREGLFQNDNFQFVSEDSSHVIEMEMIYNYKTEVIKLLQQWMPQITITSKSSEAEEILEDIKNNYKKFLDPINN